MYKFVAGLAVLLSPHVAFADDFLPSDAGLAVGWSFHVDWLNDVPWGSQLRVKTVTGPAQVMVSGWDASLGSWEPIANFGLSTLATTQSGTVAFSVGSLVSPDERVLADLDVSTSYRFFHVEVRSGLPVRVIVEDCTECGNGGGGFSLLSSPPPIVVTANQSGLGGTTPAMAYDVKSNTWFRSASNNWQWLRIDFGEVVEVTRLRRYMSRDGTNITGNRGAQGEQVYVQGRTTDPRVVVPAAQTTGWSAYNNYTPNAWHSVVYGWSAWLNFNTAKRVRYVEFNWDGNSDALNEVEVTYTRYDATPPTVTSVPPYASRVGVTLNYQVQVTDPDPGESYTYSIPSNPGGATISASGLFSWTPQLQHAGGPREVTIRVTDSWERSTDHTFYLGVKYIDSSIGSNIAALGSASVVITPNLSEFPTSAMMGFHVPNAWAEEHRAKAFSLLAGRLSGVAGVNNVRLFQYGSEISAQITNAGLASLAENPWVGAVVLASQIPKYPDLDESTVHIGATPSEAYLHLGTGVGGTVAVIDSGVDTDHEFIGSRTVGEACFSSAALETSCPSEGVIGPGMGMFCTQFGACDHGTHVAGIAMGSRPTDPTCTASRQTALSCRSWRLVAIGVCPTPLMVALGSMTMQFEQHSSTSTILARCTTLLAST